MSEKSTHEDSAELASEIFDHFCSSASTLKSILGSFSLLLDTLGLQSGPFPDFYPKLKKGLLPSWKAKALWSKLDKRSSLKIYRSGKICSNQRVLIIGGGPCGLRTAIEAQLLGAKVVLLEKRDRFSRHNVLHLWPYNITDLRGLAAKKFYGKFCAGSIDHISIRQLQCILLKVCLLLGVQVFEKTTFEELLPPLDSTTGWRAKISPSNHPVSHYEFDVLVGADGKRNTLPGFKRKEFRGKLAIAITANFVNRHTEMESTIEEISGVAFIFNQKFFKDLKEKQGIDLENIVYYKDETHYFVMTAKKQSLLDKGVILRNDADTAKLLAPENINQEALFTYARLAADFATKNRLENADFAVNHYGKPDVAMFDFTSMFQAENSCRLTEKLGHTLLTSLVGDSLLEPFWPTGTGCARGFFSGFDAMWMMRALSLGKETPLEILAERESIYRILAQTTPENTSKDYSSYTLDPSSRYNRLNTKLVLPFQIRHLFESDKQVHESREEILKGRENWKDFSPTLLFNWIEQILSSSYSNDIDSVRDGRSLCAIIHHYRPDLMDFDSLRPENKSANIQLGFETLEREFGIPAPSIQSTEWFSSPHKLSFISYISKIYETFKKDIPAIKQRRSFSAEELFLLHKSRMKHNKKKQEKNSNEEDDKDDKENRSNTRKHLEYSSKRKFVGSIKREERYKRIEEQFTGGKRRDKAKMNDKRNDGIGKINKNDWNLKSIEDQIRKQKKKPEISSIKDKVPKWSKAAFQDKFNIMKDKLENKTVLDSNTKFNDIDSSLARIQTKLREGSTLETGQRGSNKVSALASELFSKKKSSSPPPLGPRSKSGFFVPSYSKNGSEICHFCSKRVYVVERMSSEGKFFHRSCFRCDYCNILLRLGNYVYRRDGPLGGKFYCISHYTETYLEKYRYRRKEDEIKDAENRRNKRRNIKKKSMSPLLQKEKEKLVKESQIRRQSTPEKIDYEVSVETKDNEEKKPHMLDEDEWTDRNFGNSVLETHSENYSDTSDDCVSDLDSDTEGKEKEKSSSKEKEWMQRYDSYQGNYKSEIESSDTESASYEDDEYESLESSSSSADSNVRLVVPSLHRRSSSSEFESEDLSSLNSELNASESNSECQFTDSEGHPNPFIKDVDDGSFMKSKRKNKVSEAAKTSLMTSSSPSVPASNSLASDTNRFKYKTPDISERLHKQQIVDSVLPNANASSRRALNLKKNWAANNFVPSSSGNKQILDSAEIDSRLKSLMTRLSHQQKLLNPAPDVEPSREMKHVLESSRNIGNRVSSSSASSLLITSPLHSFHSKSLSLASPPISESLSPNEKLDESSNHEIEYLQCEKEKKEENEKKEPDFVKEEKKEMKPLNPSLSSPSIVENISTIEEIIFESCNEENDLLEEAINIQPYPVIISQENEFSRITKEPEPVVLLENELVNIYEERNPSEKIAKINSYKQKQSSVIHDMILSKQSKIPKKSTSHARSFNINVSPLGRTPPPPPVSDLPPETPIKHGNSTFRCDNGSDVYDDDDGQKKILLLKNISLPSTPTRGAVTESSCRFSGSDFVYMDDSIVSAPNSPTKKEVPKKSLMQSISGFFTRASTSPNHSFSKIFSSAPKAESEDVNSFEENVDEGGVDEKYRNGKWKSVENSQMYSENNRHDDNNVLHRFYEEELPRNCNKKEMEKFDAQRKKSKSLQVI